MIIYTMSLPFTLIVLNSHKKRIGITPNPLTKKICGDIFYLQSEIPAFK